MKTLLSLIFIFNSFLFSSELLSYTKGTNTFSYCIEDYYFKDNRLYFKKSSSSVYSSVLLNSKVKTYSFTSGYIYNGNTCTKNSLITSDFISDSTKELNHNNLSILGLSNEDLNLMFSFSGLMTSFLFLFGLFRWI